MSLLQKEFRRLQFPQVVSLLYLVPEGVGALSTEIIHIDGTDLPDLPDLPRRVDVWVSHTLGEPLTPSSYPAPRPR